MEERNINTICSHYSKNNSTKRLVRILFSALVVMFLVGSVALADDIPFSGTHDDGLSVTTWDVTDLITQANNVYSMLVYISYPLWGVSFVTCGVKVLVSADEKVQSKAMSQMKMSLVAIVAIHLLPLVIHAGYELTNGFRWDPYLGTSS